MWFIVVGCSAALVHWLVVVACVEHLALPPLLANLIGWLLAFVVSFSGHYRLTFRHHSASMLTAARRFFMVSAAGFLLNEASYAWLLKATPLRYDLLLGLVLVGVAVLTFILGRLWAFGKAAA